MEDQISSEEAFTRCRDLLAVCEKEAARRIVGQREIIRGIFTAMIAGGHVLLEGPPGLAKTLAVKTCADISGLGFKRIQFTPDLLPADITGTLMYEQHTATFSVRRGPVFANVVLADEINRAPAKVQSALLEAMAEGQVTIGEESHSLPDPFFVLATQNPIEQEGTYTLPEAELDRFLMKLFVPYPTAEEELAILTGEGEQAAVRPLFSAERIASCRRLAELVSVDERIAQYIVSIVHATRPVPVPSASKQRDDIWRCLSFGASPRGSIALLRSARVRALFDGRAFVLPEDVKETAPAVLRHRLVLSYEAAAEGVSADDLIAKILDLMPVP